MSNKDNSEKQKPAAGVEWNLSDLYSGMKDPQIEKNRKLITEEINEFSKKYKGKINSSNLTAKYLHKALQEYEGILERLYIYQVFAHLLYAKETSSEKVGQFYQEAQEFSNNTQTKLLWFELEWTQLDNKIAGKVTRSPELSNYRHYLTHERVFKPFRLSEPEEKIITQKSQTSTQAFVRFYDEIDSEIKYDIKVNGETKKLSYQELKPILMSHPNRETRKSAAKGLTAGLQNSARLYTYILNTLLLDKKVNDTIRGYKYPQQATLLSYEIRPETVEIMVAAIRKRYKIAEDFYQVKKQTLGYNQLYEWDRYNTIFPDVESEYTWQEAKQVVLNSFNEASPEFAQAAQSYFDRNLIDAEITPGKKSGAFHNSSVPSKPSYVFVNYSGKLEDVMTLAHELGHGVHSHLSKKHNLLQYYYSTAVAEIASIFGEMLVFDKLYHQLEDKKLKINLLANRIQGVFSTVFRQNAFYLFEVDIHTHRREKGELKTEDFNHYLQRRMQAMFGKGLQLTDGHHFWWMPVMHFYHFNFYVFSYAFGELLTTALYALYKDNGEAFVRNYLEALSAGGSKDPYEITQMMGVDIDDPKFWDQGLDVVKEQVDEFKKLAAST